MKYNIIMNIKNACSNGIVKRIMKCRLVPLVFVEEKSKGMVDV